MMWVSALRSLSIKDITLKNHKLDKALSVSRLFLSAAVIAALTTLSVAAQDQNSTNTDGTSQTQTADKVENTSTPEVIAKDKVETETETETETTVQEKIETKNTNSADERFIPTEEISEDLPVSFPVDI